MTTIDDYIQDFSAMLGLAPSRVPEPYDCVGEQLGQAVGALTDELAGILYGQSKHSSLCHMSEGRALDMMLGLHMELVREDEWVSAPTSTFSL